jgi:hypothetical protein
MSREIRRTQSVEQLFDRLAELHEAEDSELRNREALAVIIEISRRVVQALEEIAHVKGPQQ